MINRDDLKIVRSRRNSSVDEEPFCDGVHHNTHRRLSLEEKLNDVAESILVNTSCLAIGNIVIRKYAVLKTLWCIAFVLCSILTIRQLYSLSTTYFSYPVSTYMELKYAQFEFPSITLCNLNPLRRSKIKQEATPKLYDFLHTLEAKFKDVVDNGTELSTHERDWKKFRMLLSNNSIENITRMGHQVEDMVLQCAYNGKPCNVKKVFSRFTSRTYGNCYTFNSWMNFNKTDSWMAKYGENNGLILTLFVEQDEYLANFISSAGIRLHVHEPRSFEVPQFHGFSIPPGFEISLGLSLKELIRLEKPYGNCTDGKEFESIYKMKYTMKACQEVCQHQKIATNCGCFDSINRQFHANKSLKACKSAQEYQCMLKFASQEDITSLSCPCFLPCTERKYQIKQSMSEWPADSYERRFFGDLYDLHPRINRLRNQTKSLIRRNLINLIIYVEDTYYSEIKEKAAYGWDNYLSDIGGSLSLFLGFSVLTAFELLEALGLFSAYLFGKVIYRSPESKKLVSSKDPPPTYGK